MSEPYWTDDGTMTRWVWVSLPWATFGLGIAGGRVVDAAPIARWAIGKDERQVAAYYQRRGAEFRDVRMDSAPGVAP